MFLRRHAWFLLGFAILSGLAAGLSLGYRFLPLQDWPQACLQASILRHFDEPSFRFAEFYRIDSWFVPYQGFRFLQVWLAAPLGDDLGMRAALLVYLVGMPCAFFGVVRSCGLDVWRSLGAFAIVVEANFLWGFAAHVMAVTLLLLAVVAALEGVVTRAPKWLWVHLVLGIALFFTHPIVAAVWCATAAAIFALGWQRGQLSARQWLWANASIVPGAACLVFYLFFRGWVDGSALQDHGNQVYGAGFSWRTPWQALIEAPKDSGLPSVAPGAVLVFLAAVLGAQLVGASSAREQQRDQARRPWPWLLVGVWVALWLLLPADARSERVAARLVSLLGLALLLLPAWPRLRASARSRLFGRTLLVGCAAYLLLSSHARLPSPTTRSRRSPGWQSWCRRAARWRSSPTPRRAAPSSTASTSTSAPTSR
jgi:hypothetical protein